MLSIHTAKECAARIGREGFTYDFPVTTKKLIADDIGPLIGQEVYLSLREPAFPNNGVKIMVTDISQTKIYGKVAFSRQVSDFDLSNVSAIEWTEPVHKRITVES